MNKLNISLLELLNMLKATESYFKGEKAPVLLVNKISKKKGKKGSKKKLNPKARSQRRRRRRSLPKAPIIGVTKKGTGRGTARTTLHV